MLSPVPVVNVVVYPPVEQGVVVCVNFSPVVVLVIDVVDDVGVIDELVVNIVGGVVVVLVIVEVVVVIPAEVVVEDSTLVVVPSAVVIVCELDEDETALR